MEIQITKVDDSTEDLLVDFTTPYGVGQAYWNGTKKYKPEVNEKYQVEFDVTDPLDWGRDIKLSNKNEYSIEFNEEAVIMVGKLEGIDQDGIANLRFGDNLIQLEVEGGKLPVGKFVEVSIIGLELYEKGY